MSDQKLCDEYGMSDHEEWPPDHYFDCVVCHRFEVPHPWEACDDCQELLYEESELSKEEA